MPDLGKGKSVTIDITNPLAAFIGITVTAGKIELKFIGSNQPTKSLSPKNPNTPYRIRRPSNASAIELTGRGDINTYLEPLTGYTSQQQRTGLDKTPDQLA